MNAEQIIEIAKRGTSHERQVPNAHGQVLWSVYRNWRYDHTTGVMIRIVDIEKREPVMTISLPEVWPLPTRIDDTNSLVPKISKRKKRISTADV